MDPATFALAAESHELTRAKVAEYQARYKIGRRVLFRWKKLGAPLSDAAAMPAWYNRTHKWSVPEALLAAAAEAARQKARPSPAATPLATDPPAPTAPALEHVTSPPDPSQAPAPGRIMPVLNLRELVFDPNELVANAARRVAALDKRIEDAYAGRSNEDVDFLEAKLLKGVEGLRKLKDSDQKMRVQMGEYTPTRDIERDLATLVELHRQMDETEWRRVDELCPSLAPEQRAEVAAAIARIGEARRRIFRQLGTIRSVDDAVLELAAA